MFFPLVQHGTPYNFGDTTWDPENISDYGVLSDGNLTFSYETPAGNDRGQAVLCNSGVFSGKYYWEITINSNGQGEGQQDWQDNILLGVVRFDNDITGNANVDFGAAIAAPKMYVRNYFNAGVPAPDPRNDTVILLSGSASVTAANSGNPFGGGVLWTPTFGAVDDVVGFALDLPGARLFGHKNGTYWAGGDPEAGTGPIYYDLDDVGTYYWTAFAWFNNLININVSITANFGASPMLYPVPAGFVPGIPFL